MALRSFDIDSYYSKLYMRMLLVSAYDTTTKRNMTTQKIPASG